MWVWLKIKLTLKGDHTKTDINFFMHNSKRYLHGQIWRLSVPNTPKRDDEHSRHINAGFPPSL